MRPHHRAPAAGVSHSLNLYYNHRTDPLEQLIARNADASLRSGPASRGFYDENRRCCGVTKRLREFIRSGGQVAATRVSRPGWRTMTSSRATGAKIHRVLLHGIICVPSGRCVCAASGSPAPDMRLTAQAFSRACLAAAREFLQATGLAATVGELIVAHPRFAVATRIDLMCTNGAGRPVVVSWKSGSGPANARELRRHKTQVAFEWAMVEAAGERVVRAYVVYVGGVARGAAVVPYYHVITVMRDEARALSDAFSAWLEQRQARKANK